MKTMTTVTFNTNGVKSTILHIKGEISMADINVRPISKYVEGHSTDHFGQSEPVLQPCFIELGESTIIEIDVEDYDEKYSAICFNSVHDFVECFKKYCLLHCIFG